MQWSLGRFRRAFTISAILVAALFLASAAHASIILESVYDTSPVSFEPDETAIGLTTQNGGLQGPCQYLSAYSLPSPAVGFKKQLPERRVRLCGDATGAPTQGLEWLALYGQRQRGRRFLRHLHGDPNRLV
jgi:hypothetical protein